MSSGQHPMRLTLNAGFRNFPRHDAAVPSPTPGPHFFRSKCTKTRNLSTSQEQQIAMLSLQDFRDLTEGPFDRRLMAYLRLRGFTRFSITWDIPWHPAFPESSNIEEFATAPDVCDLYRGENIASILDEEAQFLRHSELLRVVDNKSMRQWLDELLQDRDHCLPPGGRKITLHIDWNFADFLVSVLAEWDWDDDEVPEESYTSSEEEFDLSTLEAGPRLYAFVEMYCKDTREPLPEPLHTLVMYELLLEKLGRHSDGVRALQELRMEMPDGFLVRSVGQSQAVSTRNGWEAEEGPDNYYDMCLRNGWTTLEADGRGES
jgi:hypothetical protein